ncbi:type I-E CRISPR-associated protein Cse2/CasB [Nitrincola alkalisediminis]|uniref:type I-E CRISPR-associated protein Cse2/CasB n=1 Tax=Nitrincola alkalisediminis TaxID=1366656 RepID=UPI0018761C96|nr:type I-E CRISPR-associated protein Cse2/CasB [Nitrincola alkalisediminis]
MSSTTEKKERREKALSVVERWWMQMALSQEELKAKNLHKAPTRYRAELRRCENADAAMLTEAFRDLWLHLPEEISQEKQYNIQAYATIAAVLSHITKSDTKRFAASLGSIDTKTDKPVVSELRLQQLQAAKDPDVFFRRLHRLVKQLKGVANPRELASDILDWFDEHYGHVTTRRADKRVAVRWALDYFGAQSRKVSQSTAD